MLQKSRTSQVYGGKGEAEPQYREPLYGTWVRLGKTGYLGFDVIPSDDQFIA